MSVEPPSSGRPTGPPSGPLSGPSQPPSGPPSQPPGSSGGTPSPEPHRPWWKSAPRVAVLTAVVVGAVVLGLVFTRSDGGSDSASGSGGEVFLQSAAKTGPDPFTESTAKDSSAAPVSASPATESTPANAVRGVDGGAAGLYGGSLNVSACDVEKQIKSLQATPSKNQAFASVEGIQPAQVPTYLRSLTPVQLRMDTRVTNHGYRNGAATSYQAVLQTGTAVLVDGHGVPRVRCACGNPLTPPVAQQTAPKPTGDSWASYRSSNVVVVTPAPQIINIFVIYDPHHDQWIARHRGDTGHKDEHTRPPVNHPSPSVSVSTPTTPSSPSTPSPSPCVSSPTASLGTPTPSGSPCPPTSTAPPSSPSSQTPSSEPPTSEPESSGSSGSSASQEPFAPDTADTTAASSSASGPPSTYSAPGSSATTPAF
ncbi:DUF6777 domain-containing protein [Streptomyces pseudovenezuelae]|uniref:DUF6777 domain-containing protein n=1 Tax=Streptomyces pseudovenezuelae TaxID=67350 RepID=A0ABT6LYV6_9ACTN|nr:DUF6777 domain-containing protein [Streptomyces pseudovenezuelae]MDH6220901.1 hypothetical protein [Streptomyces pseudovenezuelae]